jgi:hypothetical protein
MMTSTIAESPLLGGGARLPSKPSSKGDFDFNGPKRQGYQMKRPPVSILVRCFDYANHKSSIAQQAFPEGVVKAEQNLNSAGVLGPRSAADVSQVGKTHDVRVKSGDRLPAPTRKSGTQQKQDALAQVWLCAPATDHCWGDQFHRRYAQASAGVPRGFIPPCSARPISTAECHGRRHAVAPAMFVGDFYRRNLGFPVPGCYRLGGSPTLPRPWVPLAQGSFTVPKRAPRGGAHALCINP